MQSVTPAFKKYIFVCEHVRETGECCSGEGARLRENLKAMVKERKLDSKIRVSRSGCLDVCSEGPNVLLMPDNIWFKKVAASDLGAIVDKAAVSLGVS